MNVQFAGVVHKLRRYNSRTWGAGCGLTVFCGLEGDRVFWEERLTKEPVNCITCITEGEPP